MTFVAPQWLWGLVCVPILWWLASRRALGGVSDARRGPSARWLQVDGRGARPATDRTRRHRIGAWASAGVAFGVVALAQPQWGEGETIRFDQGREVLIALDLSRSMLATDVAPSRLARARLLIESTLDELRGERVGLLLFAGTAFLQSPLSADHEVLRELLPVLEPGYLPQGGTDFASMIDAALEAFSQTGAADRFLVVLSDGESPNFSLEAVEALAEAGVRVVALGIGTEGGALIPDGRGGIVKDARGAAVLSRLERPVLEELARGTDGVYVDAAQWIDLASLVERTVSEGREGQFVEERARARIHRFQWWLAPALLLLLASHVFEVPAPPRARRLHDGRASRAAATAASLAVLLLVMTPHRVQAVDSEMTPDRVQAVESDVEPQRTQAADPEAAPPADPIVTLVEQLAGSSEITATDYAELARVTAATGFDRQEENAPLPPGAITDGLAAVQTGRRLDPEAARWDDLRKALEALAEPPEQQQQQQEGGEGDPSESQSGQEDGSEERQSGDAGEQPQSGSEGAESDSQSEDESQAGDADSNPSGADPGDRESGGADDAGSEQEQAAQSKPGEGEGGAEEEQQAGQGGERPRGDPQAMTEDAAGFGELEGGAGEGDDDESEQAGPGGGEPPREPPPSRMVGGTRSANEDLLQARPDLASAIGRMERVREGDAPALLFDRMNRAEGQADTRESAGGQDW